MQEFVISKPQHFSENDVTYIIIRNYRNKENVLQGNLQVEIDYDNDCFN